jgi:hypothetical protein
MLSVTVGLGIRVKMRDVRVLCCGEVEVLLEQIAWSFGLLFS